MVYRCYNFVLLIQLEFFSYAIFIYLKSEPVNISLAGSLVDDVLVVVVAQAPRELLVVHLRLILTHAPASSNLGQNKKT